MAIIEARRGPTLKPRVNVSRPSSGAQDRVAFNAALMEGIPSSATHMGIDHDEAGRRLKFYPVTGEDYGGSPAHKLLPDGGKKRESGARIVLVRRPDLAFLVPGRYEPHGIGTLAGGGFESGTGSPRRRRAQRVAQETLPILSMKRSEASEQPGRVPRKRRRRAQRVAQEALPILSMKRSETSEQPGRVPRKRRRRAQRVAQETLPILVHEAKRAPQAEATSAASRPGGASDLVHEAKRGQRAARQRETPKPRKGRRKK